MRTATIDDTGRLIVVRRLELGTIPLRATATTWSRQLENRLGNLRSELVSVHSLSANRATAVYFSSPEEPWYLLAERIARGLSCDEWYWPLALPAWNRRQSTSETLRQSFRALASLPNGTEYTLQLAALLARHRVLPALLQVLAPSDLSSLQPSLSAATFFTTSFSTSPFFRAFEKDSVTPACLLLVRTWGASDLRTRWLALHLATAATATPSVIRSPNITIPPPEIIAKTFSRLVSAARMTSEARLSPTPPVESRLTPTESAAVAPPTARNSLSREAVSADTPLSPSEDRAVPFALDRVHTNAGGLFFIIPLLQRSRLPEYLATLPLETRQSFAWEIFRLTLRHARIAEDDPAYSVLPNSPASFEPLTTPYSPALFLLRAHREARRLISHTLRDLVRRPALLSSTPTHIDIFFRAGEADLQLRRAALDVDPGWVRWLTRLISYHYTRED